MAEYLVQDTSLTSVANAIRGKTGASDPLSFPEGYIQAINSISSGSGGGLPNTITAGDTPVLIAENRLAQATSNSLTASKVSITVPRAGTYRFRWIAASYYDTIRTRLYKNGVAIGTQQSVNEDDLMKEFSLDVECAAGDVICVYIKGTEYFGTMTGMVGYLVACINWDNGF